MPAQTETRSGLFWGWDYGEHGWNTGMDQNLLRLGRFGFHLSVKDRDLTEPPADPEDGDTYIVGLDATGAWQGYSGQVAVWVAGTPNGNWVFGKPRVGWVAYIEDEEVLSVYKAEGWSAGVAI